MGSYIALAIYVLVLGLLTFFASRRKSADDFLVASRGIGWKVIAVSTFASIISSYNIVVGITFSYMFGPWVIVVYLGILVAFGGIYYLAKNQNREIVIARKFNSIVDYFTYKFGSKNGSLLNLALMLVLFIFISLQFFVNTSVFSNILGWDKYTSSLVVGLIVLTYTLIGGLKVEILTDVFKGILMLMILGLAFMVDTSKISMGTITPFLTDSTIIIGALSLALTQFLTLLVQPEIWQRVYAARSMKDLKKGFLGAWFLLIVIVIPEIIVALSARVKGGIDDPSNLFYSILQTSSPQWFFPFIAVALFAAFMATLDSSLFALGTQLGKYGFWIKSEEATYNKEGKIVVKNIRLSIIIVTMLTLITSLFFSDLLTSVLQLISLLTVISVIILFSIIFKVSRTETFIGIIVAIVSFVISAFGGLITKEAYTTLYPSLIVFTYMLAQYLFIRVYKRIAK